MRLAALGLLIDLTAFPFSDRNDQYRYGFIIHSINKPIARLPQFDFVVVGHAAQG